MSGDHNMYQKPRSYVDDDTQYDEAQVQAMIKKAVREEREACAAVCCNMIDAEYKTGKVDHNEMAWTQACAIAIRARGEQ